MEYRQLGESELQVSEIGLGTMTFGQQNTLEETHQQLDCALFHGVNFIDAAEMYPVPARQETQGLTEEFIGKWLTRKQRDRLVIATKIAGPSRHLNWIRNGPKAIDRPNIEQAVNDSLKRLQTDYIDLYQIHWPDRYVPLFGQTAFDPRQIRDTVPIAEQLASFADLIKAGKIRYLGLSNETPWGVAQFCQVARQLGLPKVVSIQNAYNLINRVFETALAEVCYYENLGLLAYSPLGFGSLTGKYLHEKPASARLTLFPGFGQRYSKPNVDVAVMEYGAIARQYNLSPVSLALAFVRQQWFVSSTIIGATTLTQLEENLASLQVSLSPEILAEINRIHNRYPNPAP
ncbi:NADP(H)-dependent aldo-keto reductase [Leptothermofonsia sichuanensis E412]|uniref:NADP(H)-dependent aldo-keto reductase n=1 Tax=Leptothermofonsia sichuanensis TaxID=2917832 RepID=UPI001CA66759|nr:NADP(H)-dependent aldo-keto reductase [Leptothermofonsia sichuanensis]QZZ23169.1 NADP(H)-dependent aldo-keto reductase [Leptothermofonsia sichuanensis E412]